MIWIKKGKLKTHCIIKFVLNFNKIPTTFSNPSLFWTQFSLQSQILPHSEHNYHCIIKFFLIFTQFQLNYHNLFHFEHNFYQILKLFLILEMITATFSNHSSFWTHCIIKFFLIFNTIPTALSWSSSDWTQIALNYLPHSEHNFQCILKSHNSHCIIKFFLHC